MVGEAECPCRFLHSGCGLARPSAGAAQTDALGFDRANIGAQHVYGQLASRTLELGNPTGALRFSTFALVRTIAIGDPQGLWTPSAALWFSARARVRITVMEGWLGDP